MSDRMKCTRLKLSPDGMNCNAGRICERNATQIRNDGRIFCTPCAKTERNRLGADRFSWMPFQQSPDHAPITMQRFGNGYRCSAIVEGLAMAMYYPNSTRSAAFTAFQKLITVEVR